MLRIFALLLSLFMFIPVFVFADTHLPSICSKFQAPLTGGYCIHPPLGKGNRDILYYFHGNGGSELDWNDPVSLTGQLQKEFKKNRRPTPTVISVSFGPTWVFAHKNASPASGLLELFTQQIMPALEASLGGLKGRRLVMGISMGGFNTLQLAMRTSLFRKAAAICSPMGTVSPFGSAEDLQKYIEASLAWQYYKETPNVVIDAVKEMISLAQYFYPSPQDWQQADPLALARQTSIKDLPVMYVAAGYYDKYALYEATEKFAESLQRKRARIEWRPQWGGHCAADIPSLAAFLLN